MCLVGMVERRYIYIFPHITALFLQQHPYFLFIFLNVFRSCIYIILYYMVTPLTSPRGSLRSQLL